jgi:hypothetical protein
MPELTRRRYPEARDECWHVYYGDVHAGTLAIRTGNPNDTDPWEWRCGFYPGSHPGECRSGTAASLGDARAGFEEAWKVFLSNRTEADFQEWRDQRDWTARKYALWDRGRIGLKLANFARFKTHFQAVGPKHFLKTIHFIVGANALEAFGKVDILFMPFDNGTLRSLCAVYGAEEQRAGQPPNAADDRGGVSLAGGGLAGDAAGHLVCSGSGWMIGNINHCL